METTKENLAIEDYNKYYVAGVRCWNCNNKQYIYIIKGMPAYKVKKECSQCGCIINMKTGDLFTNIFNDGGPS